MKGNRPRWGTPRRQADYLKAPPLTWVQVCGSSVPAVCCDILSTTPPGPLHSLWAGGVRAQLRSEGAPHSTAQQIAPAHSHIPVLGLNYVPFLRPSPVKRQKHPAPRARVPVTLRLRCGEAELGGTFPKHHLRLPEETLHSQAWGETGRPSLHLSSP